MKNRIFKIVLALMLMLTPLALFGCGETENAIAYTKLPEILTEMHGNTTLLKKDKVDSVSSDFIIESLNNADNNYYNECFIIPINYLYNYKGEIDELKKAKDLSEGQTAILTRLGQQLYNFNSAYQALAAEQEHLNVFKDQNADIYNGILEQFKQKAAQLILQSYNVAITLSDAQAQILNRFGGMKGRGLNDSDYILLRDYLSLKVGKDCTDYLLKEVKKPKFKTPSDDALQYEKDIVNLNNHVNAKLANFISRFYGANSFKNLNEKIDNTAGIESYNNKTVTKLLEVQEAMNKERAILNRAFENVNLYNLCKNYNYDLDAYKIGRDNTEVYYYEISKYYGVYLDIKMDFLLSSMIL